MTVIHFYIKRLDRTACGKTGEYSKLSFGINCPDCRRALDEGLAKPGSTYPMAPEPAESFCEACTHSSRHHGRAGCTTGAYTPAGFERCPCKKTYLETRKQA